MTANQPSPSSRRPCIWWGQICQYHNGRSYAACGVLHADNIPMECAPNVNNSCYGIHFGWQLLSACIKLLNYDRFRHLSNSLIKPETSTRYFYYKMKLLVSKIIHGSWKFVYVPSIRSPIAINISLKAVKH